MNVSDLEGPGARLLGRPQPARLHPRNLFHRQRRNPLDSRQRSRHAVGRAFHAFDVMGSGGGRAGARLRLEMSDHGRGEVICTATFGRRANGGRAGRRRCGSRCCGRSCVTPFGEYRRRRCAASPADACSARERSAIGEQSAAASVEDMPSAGRADRRYSVAAAIRGALRPSRRASMRKRGQKQKGLPDGRPFKRWCGWQDSNPRPLGS